MGDVDKLVTAFMEMRQKEGVTYAKLENRRWLLDLLAAGTADMGIEKLHEYLDALGDRRTVRAVRNALNIKMEWHGELEERRAWANSMELDKEDRFLPVGRSTHYRLEERGFEELAQLILDRAADRVRLERGTEAVPAIAGGPDSQEPSLDEPPNESVNATACLFEAVVLGDAAEADDTDVAAPEEPSRRTGAAVSRTAGRPEPASMAAQGSSVRKVQSVRQRVVSRFPMRWHAYGRGVARQWKDDKPRVMATYGALLAVLLAASALLAYYAIFVPTPQTADPQVVESSGAGGVGQVQPPASVKIDNTHGWGPDRKTFTSKNPAPYPVFNSITDISGHGDERNFVQCHDLADKGKPGAGWGDELIAHDQHSYECSIFFNNDVGANLDSVASPSPFIEGNVAAKLQGAHAQVIMPSPHTYNPAIVGMLTADNANPPKVWDSCNLVSPQPVTVEYQAGSARMFTKRWAGLQARHCKRWRPAR